MKTKLFSKILGVGLAIGLVFALGAAVIPATEAQADEMEWGQVTTPSWDNLVIEPGSDISDYVAAGETGDTVYAIGAIYGGYEDDKWPTTCGDMDEAHGLSGEFDIRGGGGPWNLTVTAISDDVGTVTGSFDGTTCYLKGDFTAVMMFELDISGGDYNDDPTDFQGEMVIYGEIVDNASDYDTMTFTGHLYRDTGATVAAATVTDIAGDFDLAGKDFDITGNEIDTIEDGDLRLAYDDREIFTEPRAWMSDDGGVTWTDITPSRTPATCPAPLSSSSTAALTPHPTTRTGWPSAAASTCPPATTTTPPTTTGSATTPASSAPRPW